MIRGELLFICWVLKILIELVAFAFFGVLATISTFAKGGSWFLLNITLDIFALDFIC
jgi:hypothetical protein